MSSSVDVGATCGIRLQFLGFSPDSEASGKHPERSVSNRRCPSSSHVSGSGSGSGSDSGGGSSGSGNGISPRLPSIEDSESNLFDFDIEISAAFKTIKIGEKVQVLFTLFPFGDNFREDVVMNYYIKNSRGEVVVVVVVVVVGG